MSGPTSSTSTNSSTATNRRLFGNLTLSNTLLSRGAIGGGTSTQVSGSFCSACVVVFFPFDLCAIAFGTLGRVVSFGGQVGFATNCLCCF
jgi:hypothetical protein